MTHDEAVMLLPDLVQGSLTPIQAPAVRRHLEGCDDCRSLSEGYRLIARALREEDVAFRAAVHPDGENLVAFATGLTPLDPREHLRVARHVDGCASCSSEVEVTRAAERSLVPEPERQAPRTPRRAMAGWWAAAALAGGVLLGFPLWRTLGTGAGSSTPAWDGAYGLPVVSSALRGAAGPAVVRAPAGQAFIPVAVALPAEVDLATEGTWSFTLVASSGERVWGQDVAASRLTSTSGSSEAVLVVLPASAVRPGDYVLRVSRAGSGEPLLEAPLRVER